MGHSQEFLRSAPRRGARHRGEVRVSEISRARSVDGSSLVASEAASVVSEAAGPGGGALVCSGAGAGGGAGAAGCVAAGAAAVDVDIDDPRPLASLRSVSTPPASWTAMKAPTTMTTANATPSHAQNVWASPRMLISLMIAKMRIRTPMTAADMAEDTGSGMLTDARRTISHASG
jgi:hypothetical protein